jgi:hypothetical protein
MSALHRSAFFLILCLSAVCAVNTRTLIDTADVPLDVQSGYLHGRSGHIVVKPLEQEKIDPAVIFIESSQYIKSKDLGSLPANNVADVITRTLGVEPMNPSYSPRFVKSDLLHNARANALFSIESLGGDDISRLSLSNLQVFQDLGATASLSYNVYPQQSISLATTLATGKLPSEHGIVSKTWERRDGRTFAFVSEGPKAAPLVANVADVLQQTFNGESLIVSTSSDPQQAFAYCPNYSLMKANTDWNYLCLSSDPQSETVSAMGPRSSSPKKTALESSLICTKQKLMVDLADPRMSFLSDLSDISATIIGSKVIVSSSKDRSAPVTFDLNVPEDRALFSELQYAHTLTGRLKVVGQLNSLVTDDVPDFYALTFASLTGLSEKYGRTSPQVKTGARLIDAALPSFVEGLQSLYPQRLVAEIVLMGSHQTPSPSLLEDISSVSSSSADYYPYVYVQNAMAVQKLCEDMASALNPKSVAVYCPDSAAYSFSLLAVPGDSSSNSTAPTQQQIETYQIGLWFSLGWIFIVLWAVYILGWMSFKKDTFLYSTFNPNWEDRKRR